MKLAIVVLVLVAVLFAVALGFGFRKEPDRAQQKKDAQEGNPPEWTQVLKRAANSQMPKIKLPKDRLEVPPDTTFQIEPSKDQAFRLLHLVYESGSEVQVEFHSKEPPPKMGNKGEGMDDPQKFTLIASKKDDQENHRFHESSIVVFKSGGTLKLSPAGGPLGGTRKGFVKVERSPSRPWPGPPGAP